MKSTKLKFPSDISGRLVGVLFLALIPLVTLIPDNPIPVFLTQDFLLRWVSLIIFFLCLGKVLLNSKTPNSLTLDLPNMLFLLLVIWVLLSVFNSKEAFNSFYAYRSFLALVLLWFSLRLVWGRWPELFPWFERFFYWTALLAAAWVILTTLGHKLGVPFFVNVTIPRQGSFPNENIAAGYLGMAILWGLNQKLFRKQVSWIGIGFLFFAWGLTESRGALIFMSALVVFYLVLHMKEIEKILAKWNVRQWVLFGMVVLFIAACLSFMVDRVLMGESADPRSYFRIDVWISSFKMVWAQPLFGFGPGTYADVYPYYRPIWLWNTYNPFAHNEFLQVGAECGLPALLLVLFLVWAFLREFLISLKKSPLFGSASPTFQTANLAFFIVLFEALHNSVDFTFHEWSHRLVLLAFVTYALRERKTEEDLKMTFQFSPRVFLMGLLTVILFAGWSLGVGGLRDYLARVYDFNSVMSQRAGDLDAAESSARKSLGFRSNDLDPWNSLGAIEDARAGMTKDVEEKSKHYQKADDYFQKAIQCSPFAVDPKVNQVQSLLKRGRLSQALDIQAQLVASGPELPSSYADLARILLKMGRAKEAIGPAQKMIDEFPFFLPGYFLKAESLESLGRKKEALKTFEDAQEELNHLNISDPSGQIQPNIDRLKGLS